MTSKPDPNRIQTGSTQATQCSAISGVPLDPKNEVLYNVNTLTEILMNDNVDIKHIPVVNSKSTLEEIQVAFELLKHESDNSMMGELEDEFILELENLRNDWAGPKYTSLIKNVKKLKKDAECVDILKGEYKKKPPHQKITEFLVESIPAIFIMFDKFSKKTVTSVKAKPNSKT
jgi:hypothetical protein